MSGTTTSATDTNKTTPTPASPPVVVLTPEQVAAMCQAIKCTTEGGTLLITPPEKPDTYQKKNPNDMTAFGASYGYEAFSGSHLVGLRFLPQLKGLGFRGEFGATNDFKQLGGRFGVNATGPITDRLSFTLAMDVMGAYDGRDPSVKTATLGASAFGGLRYMPLPWLSLKLSGRLNAQGTFALDVDQAKLEFERAKTAAEDLAKDVGQKVNQFLNDLGNIPISDTLKTSLQAAVTREMRALAAGLPSAALSAATGSGSAMSTLFQTALNNIMASVPPALQAEANGFKAAAEARFNQLVEEVKQCAKQSAENYANNYQSPAQTSYSISADVEAGAKVKVPLLQQKSSEGSIPGQLYLLAGLTGYAHVPIAGNDTHTILPTDRDPSALRLGWRPSLGIGGQIPGTYLNVDLGLTYDQAVSRDQVSGKWSLDKPQLTVGTNLTLFFP